MTGNDSKKDQKMIAVGLQAIERRKKLKPSCIYIYFRCTFGVARYYKSEIPKYLHSK